MASSTIPGPFIPIQRTYKKSHFPNIEQYSNALFTCTNLASHTLVRCPRHLTHLPSSFSTTKNHGWCILLSCDICDFFWCICSQCPNARSRMNNKSQCNRHHVKFHHSSNTNINPSNALAHAGRSHNRIQPINPPLWRHQSIPRPPQQFPTY
jgi:hypothetical protein